MNKKLIRLTESDLHRIVKESVSKILNEQHIIRVQYDKDLSQYKGREYFYCRDNGRYYTNIDGEWLICTDNYYLEPDCHLEDDVKVVVESVNKVLTELDWKTYANAEKKALSKGDNRANAFRDAKIRAFNDKYSATREPKPIHNDMYDGYTSEDTYEMKPHRERLSPWVENDIPTYERDGKYRRALNTTGRYFNPDDGFDDTFDDINWSLKGYDEFGKKSQLGDSDFKSYIKGDSKYVKGQGWK